MVKRGKAMVCPPGGCPKWFAWLVLIVGLWFLAADFGILSTWGINWWSAVLTLVGLHCVSKCA